MDLLDNSSTSVAPSNTPSSDATAQTAITSLPRLFTISDACAYLGIHERTLRGFISKGQVRAYRIGRSFRFHENDLQDALKPFVPDASSCTELDDFIERQISGKPGVRP